jgi:serine/threonine protein kinase
MTMRALIPRTLPDLEHEAEEWTGLGLHSNITYCYHLHPVGTPPLPLLVVEYVAGGTLRQRTEAVSDLRGNLDLAIQLCHALEHAHGRGLIHRDLRPENVLLTADGTVKLTDLDIARRGVAAGAPGAVGGMVQSSTIGTVGYMAPEQLIPGAVSGGSTSRRGGQATVGASRVCVEASRVCESRGVSCRTWEISATIDHSLFAEV